ncbi:MAG: hypothetical protein ABSE73_27995 [Planctomycetota bacterium]
MNRSTSLAVLFAMLASPGLIPAGEAAPDVDARLQDMQQRMAAMTQELESQRRTIGEQQRAIRQLSDAQRAIATNPGIESLKNPANPQIPKTTEGEEAGKTEAKPRHSWDLPAITVTGEAGALREEEKIGSYDQPRWTARRRFSETRAYVMPENEFELEYWSILELPRHGAPSNIETKYEVEMGLPHRLQLDLYGITNQTGHNGPLKFDEQDLEVRYAFANWGKLPANPTMYVEYKALDSAAPHYECKLLFADETSIKGLHWSANTVFEHEMGGSQDTRDTLGGSQENSYEITGGVSYTIVDQKFSVGGETKIDCVDTRSDRGLRKPEVLLGPSFQISPLKQMHINIAPLAGLTRNSLAFKSLLIVGWEF